MTTYRRNTRQAIANMLTSAGITTVYQAMPSDPMSEFPVAIITLPEARETVVSSGGPGAGRKRIDYDPVTVQIWNISNSGDGVTDELAFDDLLDAVDAQLRSDVTLGGAVLQAGIKYIETIKPDSTEDENETLIFVAEKKFDVTIEINW